MLGKLIKHEFKGTYKIFGLVFGALIAVAVLARLTFVIPVDNELFKIVSRLLELAFVLLVIGVSVAGIVVMLIRFERTMLKDEGYLTHTLPVKKWELLISKLITYCVWTIATVIMIIIAFAIYRADLDDLSGFFNDLGKVFSLMGDYPTLIGMAVLLIITILFGLIKTVLNCFAALSIGYSFAKHKIMKSVIAFFGLNYVLVFIAMILEKPFHGQTERLVNYMENVTRKIDNAETIKELITVASPAVYGAITVVLVAEIIISIIFFAISNYMLSKKLNLE